MRVTVKHYGFFAAILVAAVSCTPAPRATGAVQSAPVAVAVAHPKSLADPLPVLLAPEPVDEVAPAAAPEVAPPFAPAARADDADRAVACLTEAVYYEARSEPLDGQRAVAQVVLNRVRNPAFPASVCGVVHQRSAANGVCQFTYFCDGSMRARREDMAWDVASRIAEEAFRGAVYAPAGAATFYHTSAVAPWWSQRLTRIAAIGAHIFYRLGDAMSRKLDFRQDYAAAEPQGTAIVADDVRTARVVRYLTDGAAVTVHRGATPTDGPDDIAGVVVHLGPQADAGEAFAGVRVHVGTPSAPATAEAVTGPA